MKKTNRGHLQLWWPILGILGCLLLTCPAEVPEHNLAVITGTCQDRLLKWMPRDRLHRIGVAFERVEL